MALVVTYTNGNLLFTDTGTQLITNTIALSPNDVIENRADGSVIIYADAKCSVVKAKFNRYTELSPAIVAPDLFVYKALPLPVTNIPSATEIASTEWGYSSDNDKVFIITNANGNTRFESPIGTPYIPTSDVLPISGKVGNFVLVSLTSSGSGSTIDGAHRVVFSWDSNSTPTINGVVQINTGGQSLSCKIFDATILGDGRYVGVPSISFDGSAGAIVIDQLIL